MMPSTPQIASPAVKWLLFASCLFVALFILLIYATILWGAFARVWGSDNSLTFQHFKYVFGVGFKAVKDTLIIAGLSTPLAGILGMIIAFLVVRKQFPGKRFMELSSMLSFAVPGTVVGIGYVLAFNSRPLLLTGTLLILLLNFIFRYIPVGIQSGVVSPQAGPTLRRAAAESRFGPGDHQQAERAAVRRTPLQPGCQAARTEFVADFIGKVNLIEGRVVDTKGKAFVVEYAKGRKVIASAGDALKQGQKILTVIRPESLRLEQTTASHSDFLRCKVVKMVYLGPTVEYELALEGLKRTIAAVVSNPIEAGFFEIGEEVALDFHPQAAHLIPA